MRRIVVLIVALGIPAVLGLALSGALAQASGPSVLRVGTYKGSKGDFNSIQAAVDAAKPGDWILVAPGDYKTTSSRRPGGRPDLPAGVLVTKKGLKIRGMDRNSVIVDGTKSGPQCSRSKADQNLGPRGKGGAKGLNGIMVWKADNVWVQNLTACNFLHGSGDTGNEIWWNGGDGSGKIGGWGFYGSYLTSTSTFYNGESTAAAYGIFSSNWSGGTWNRSYASNFNDSGYYIGACQQVCDQTVSRAWAEFNALGYSGSNSGGKLVVKDSQFDHNEDGFDTNSQNGDNPPPQNGACPKGVKPPVAGAHSCWVFTHNYVHDNNNPNIPSAGAAAAGPVGTGTSISGGRNDTIMHSRFVHNGAWGVIFVPYPDSTASPCTGGTPDLLGPGTCWYDEYGDALIDNTFSRDGFFHNPTNGDFAQTNAEPGPTDCYRGNKEKGGGKVKSSPSNLQQMYPKCNGKTVPPDSNGEFTTQVACDSQISLGGGGAVPCPPGTHYPRRKKVVMRPLPANLATMPDPCTGVPTNPWCP